MQIDLTPLLTDIAGASKLLGVGKSLLYEMASDGRLGPISVRFGKKRLFSVDELRTWVEHRCPPRDEWLQILKEQNGNGDKK